jgi:hypothetical protein
VDERADRSQPCTSGYAGGIHKGAVATSYGWHAALQCLSTRATSTLHYIYYQRDSSLAWKSVESRRVTWWQLSQCLCGGAGTLDCELDPLCGTFLSFVMCLGGTLNIPEWHQRARRR